MDLDDFRRNFLNEAAAWAATDLNFAHASFVEVAIRYLSDAGEVADFEPNYYRGAGDRRRSLAVDGYAFDEADGSLRIFLAETFLDDATPTLTQTDARALFGRLRAFLEEAVDGRLANALEVSSPTHALAIDLAARIPNTSRVRAYLLTDAVMSARARDWPEGEILGVPLEFHIWDIVRFHRLHTSRSGRDELVIDLSAFADGGLPCIAAAEDSEGYAAYLCVVPGRVLAEMYEEYGSRLLEGNVRSFLTTRGRVNKGIRNTLLHESDMFFAYNNGIAATASSVSIGHTSAGMVILSATDLQIVNGGQTTASLAAVKRNDRVSLDRVHVPMKLSVVTPERSGEMIPLISRYANTQNRVSDADFFSNHEFHRRLQEISRRIWAPAVGGAQHETHWFYERTRGQYMNETASMTHADARRFEQMNPRGQVITKTDLAKTENCWRQLPHTVSKGAQKNFMDFAVFVTGRWDADPASFNEDYWKSVVGRTMLFRATEKLVSAQEWYSGGYRANVVAYTISRLARLVEHETDGWRIDFGEIWRRQAISADLKRQLALIAKAMHEVITAPPAGIQNVTEWSKKEACWDQAKRRDVDLLPELRAELIEMSTLRDIQQDARAQQKQDTGIDAQMSVVELGAEYWVALLAWSQANFPISPDEDRLVRMAAGLTSGLPSDKQSTRLLQLKERLELEGLAPPAQRTPT